MIVLRQFTYFRYNIDEPQGGYVFIINEPSGWVHAVMVYHGVGQGITVYHDGMVVGTDTSRAVGTRVQGTGDMFIGRRLDNSGSLYASVHVDELKLYNRQLSADEISEMY